MSTAAADVKAKRNGIGKNFLNFWSDGKTMKNSSPSWEKESNDQLCFIKPTNYDQKKSSKFKKQIGLVEDMRCDPKEDCFTCAQGQTLPLRLCRSIQVEGTFGFRRFLTKGKANIRAELFLLAMAFGANSFHI